MTTIEGRAVHNGAIAGTTLRLCDEIYKHATQQLACTKAKAIVQHEIAIRRLNIGILKDHLARYIINPADQERAKQTIAHLTALNDRHAPSDGPGAVGYAD